MTLTDACLFNDSTLFELESFLNQLPDSHYPEADLTASCSIGPHIRHIIEFYQCFFKGLDFGVIDYDNRPRNKELEKDPEVALRCVQNLRLLLTAQDLSHYPEYVEVVACTGVKDNRIQAPSNLVRELMFLQSHTTHHLALIAILLKSSGIQTPESFGLATSTRIFQQNNQDNTVTESGA